MTHNKTKQMYQCSVCKIRKVPLWREYSIFNPKLFCANCAIDNQGVMNIKVKGDNIGRLIPAIPISNTFIKFQDITLEKRKHCKKALL